MMRFGQTVKRVQLLKINAQVSSIWAKGCVCVLSDLTSLPLLGVRRKPWYIIIISYLVLTCYVYYYCT